MTKELSESFDSVSVKPPKICSVCSKSISYSNYSAHFKKCSQNTNVENLIKHNSRLQAELQMMTQNYVEAETKYQEILKINDKLHNTNLILISKFASIPVNISLD